MKKEQKFYICKHCGNIVGMIENSGVNPVCCNDKMTALVPNTTDASTEKHVPVIKLDGKLVTVEIGSAPHPMTEEHHISWVYLLTDQGGQRKDLDHTGVPSVSFMLTDDDKAISAFAYCNLHGLWKADV